MTKLPKRHSNMTQLFTDVAHLIPYNQVTDCSTWRGKDFLVGHAYVLLSWRREGNIVTITNFQYLIGHLQTFPYRPRKLRWITVLSAWFSEYVTCDITHHRLAVPFRLRLIRQFLNTNTSFQPFYDAGIAAAYYLLHVLVARSHVYVLKPDTFLPSFPGRVIKLA